MDLTALGSVVTAVGGLIATVIVALNGRSRKQRLYDQEDAVELNHLREWRIDVLRWYARLAEKLATRRIGLPDLPEYPPEPERRRRRRHRREEDDEYEDDYDELRTIQEIRDLDEPREGRER
ncbi:hypothetical protein FPZ12_029620 [Amycolatopsis acidicola]|uniref:Uncharacterized protein n=1 Tax=Amycolatopsis acidicola TaxID=2596893 RepID=A0A5N0UTK0_9PSEU|nr:hypothetical protein [Amycolatopsis acidicola]KAA9155557.1 hypothetical protein FPZ12_029620 [Amycolatopsis acidicola]